MIINLKTKTECHAVIEAMNNIVKRYKYATIADLKSLTSDNSKTYIDHKTGWTDISKVEVHRGKSNWLLTFPDPIEDLFEGRKVNLIEH